MSMGLHTTTPASSDGGVSKKHTRSRGRAKEPVDPYESADGVVPFNKFRGRPWTDAHELDESMVGKRVLVFSAACYIRPLSKTRAVAVRCCSTSPAQCPCVIDAGGGHEGVTTRVVRFAVTLRLEDPVDVEGVVILPCGPFATTQKVVTKFHSIGVGTTASRSSSTCITPETGECSGTIG